MHLRAERNGILVSLESLSIGKQQQWIDAQPVPQTRSDSQAIKRAKRLIKVSRDEESE